MITLYMTNGCLSCRKARAWLTQHDIAFIERNIISSPLTAKEIKQILKMTINGTSDIISTNSKIYQTLNMNFEELSMKQFIEVIQSNPQLLKKPIVLDDIHLQVGYSDEGLRQFLPREYRRSLKMVFSDFA